MKPSHIKTPRTMAECHFQTGYKCADERADWVWPVLGYVTLGAALVAALVAVSP